MRAVLRKKEMDKNVKIAGDLTIGDWLLMKELLDRDRGKDTFLNKAYPFFEKRIETRYLKPIEAIEKKLQH